MIEKDFFIETRKYKTKQDGLDAVWYYGLSWDSYLDNQDGIVILDFKGTKELAEKMKRSGCQYIWVGIETADETVFKSIKKGEELKNIKKGIKLLRKAGIGIGGFFIVGLPKINLFVSLVHFQWLFGIS